MSRSKVLALAVAILLLAQATPADEHGHFMSFSTEDFWEDQAIRPAGGLYYNRVDGLLFYAGVEYRSEEHLHPRLIAQRGWSSARAANHYQIEVEQPLFGQESFSFGVQFYDMTDWPRSDAQGLSDVENNLLALFFRQEFRSYYRRDGYAVFVQQHLTPELTFRLEHRDDRLSSLPTRQSVWSAFRRSLKWEENPPLEVGILDAADEFEGTMKGYYATIEYDNREPTRGHGWYARGFFEVYGTGLLDVRGWSLFGGESDSGGGGDYDFRKYELDVRRSFGLTETQSLDLRGVWGIGSGTDFASHKLFYLGGPGTLRGYDYREFSGKNVLFGSAEYRVRIRPELEMIYFVDSGQAWYGTSGFDSKETRHDIGIGFRLDAPAAGDLRVDIARPATTQEADIVVQVRLAYPS